MGNKSYMGFALDNNDCFHYWGICMKVRFASQHKGQRIIIEEFEGQVLLQSDGVVTVYVPITIAEKLREASKE